MGAIPIGHGTSTDGLFFPKGPRRRLVFVIDPALRIDPLVDLRRGRPAQTSDTQDQDNGCAHARLG